MTGESIIYFNKEWGENTTSADHVFEQLCRHNKVMWVNSIAMRNPNLGSAHDWGRIYKKVRKLLGGLRQMGPNAWLYQPFFIPLPFSKRAQTLNRRLLRLSLRRQARKLGMKNPQLWTFLPSAVYMIGELDESVVVYYCIDAWTKFVHLDGGSIAPLEDELIRKADVCFASAESILESLKARNPNTYLSRHGVDFEVFARASDPATVVPDDIARLPKPVIGFFGGLREHIDFDLLVAIARRHPEWSLVLLGLVQVNVDMLRALPNVHILGSRKYQELPAYCKGFDASIIPYLRNEFTEHVNPIKLRQYLCAGLPTIATAIPETLEYAHVASVCETHDEFIAAIEHELAADSPERRAARRETMRSESWEGKVAVVCERVMAAKEERQIKNQKSKIKSEK